MKREYPTARKRCTQIPLAQRQEREERTYRLGLLDGVWKVFDEGGAPIVTMTFRNGEEIKTEQEELPWGRAGRLINHAAYPDFSGALYDLLQLWILHPAAFQLFRERHAEAERNRFLSSFAVTADDPIDGIRLDVVVQLFRCFAFR